MSHATRSRSSWITPSAFLVLCVAAGGNAVAIRYLTTHHAVAPQWAAATRFLMATAIFAIVSLALRAPLPRGRALAGATLYGALSFGGFFGFGYYGLSHVPAALAGVMFATVPLLTFFLSLLHRLERWRWDSLIGAVLAIAGTAVIVREGLDAGADLLPLLAMLAAAVCAAEGAIVVKAFPPVHPAAMNAIGMGAGTVILFILTFGAGEPHTFPPAASAWATQAYLVVAGSVGVFALYLFVIRRWTASAVSYEFVLIPIFGALLAAWLLDEQITSAFVAGSILVLIGVYFGALRGRREHARAGPAASE